MPTTARPSYRRPITRSPLLFLLVGALAAALVATFLQIRPPSSAAEVINNVDITHGTTEASIKVGTEDACVITSKTLISGDPQRVQEVVDATSTSARQSGFTIITADGPIPAPNQAATNLILSQEFPMSDPDFGLENCSTELVIDAHRGRSTVELPAFARGMLAAAAGTAVYLAVVFAVASLFAFLAPEFFVIGELVGGCVGGFASTFIANLINQVPQAANLSQSAVQCVAGAILNVTLGTVKTNIVSSLRGWLSSGEAQAILGEGADRAGSSAALEASSRYFETTEEFAIQLAELEAPPVEP